MGVRGLGQFAGRGLPDPDGALLEPAAASFAATNASAGELNAVREAHKIACASLDMPTFEHWDAEFHHRIFACSRNDFLKEIHNRMRILRNQRPWFEMKKRSFSEERRATYCGEPQIVLDALLASDSEGASDADASEDRRAQPSGKVAARMAEPSRHCVRISLYSACSG